MNAAYEIAELKRRMENLLRVVTITELDPEAAKVRVADGVDFRTDWLPWLSRRASGEGGAANSDWDPPEVGERALLLCPSGESAAGVVLPAIYCTDHPPASIDPDKRVRRWGDGGAITYDASTGTYEVEPPASGEIALTVGPAFLTISNDEISVQAATVIVDATTATLNCDDATLTSDSVTIDSPDINLGGAGGAKVARVGDALDLTNNIIALSGGSNRVKAS